MSAPVGFIGVGAIGAPMLRRIVDAGFSAATYDINPKSLGAFAGRATLARSAAEVASVAEVVIVCLPSLESHRDAILGEAGLIHGSAVKVCAITGTTGPSLIREVEAALRGRGIAVVDAPMTGGRLRAADGTLTVMVSGDSAAIRRVEPYLKCYGNRIVMFGEKPGTAQTMKLLNNIMSAANFTMAAEAFVFGAKAGLDPERMLEVINNGTGKNDSTLTIIPNNILTRTFDFGSQVSIVIKDMTQAIVEAEQLGVPVHLTRAIRDLFEQTLQEFGGTADQTGLVQFLERMAKTEIPKTR
jgi:2-hydroxy-3-oxopropionate reductase